MASPSSCWLPLRAVVWITLDVVRSIAVFFVFFAKHPSLVAGQRVHKMSTSKGLAAESGSELSVLLQINSANLFADPNKIARDPHVVWDPVFGKDWSSDYTGKLQGFPGFSSCFGGLFYSFLWILEHVSRNQSLP